MNNTAGIGKTCFVNNSVDYIDIKDIPPNIAEELDRLHDLIKSNGGTSNREIREWAQSKVDNIHKMLFTSAFIIKEGFDA